MTVHGLAVLTACSKAGRYSSRSVRSSTSALTDIRRVSWLLTAKMLQRRADPERLHAVDPSDGETPGQERVLREVLEVPAAQRRSLHVDPRPEDDVDLEGHRLASDRLAHLAQKVRIPGGSGARRRREAGRGLGAEGHRPSGLRAPHPMRAVGHPQRRQAETGHGRGRPRGVARQQRRLFLEGHLGEVALRDRVVVRRRRTPRLVIGPGSCHRSSMAPPSRPGPVGSPRPCAGRAPAPPNARRLPPAAVRPRRRPTKGRTAGRTGRWSRTEDRRRPRTTRPRLAMRSTPGLAAHRARPCRR